MFRRDFQLPRHVVFAELAQEARRVLVGHDVVVAQAAADEHLLHLRQFAELLEDGQKFLVINLQVLARLREQTLPMLARADFQLIWTRRLAEIRRRAADIVKYGFAEADTTYGKVGVKVWIYNGEILPTKEGSDK